MWIFGQHGFLSAVVHNDDPDVLVVRARVKADARHLAEYLSLYSGAIGTRQATESLIRSEPGTDYPWRVIIPRGIFSEYLHNEVMTMDYGNYKDRVTQNQGDQRHDLYLKVWGVMLDAERQDPEQDPERRASWGVDPWAAYEGKDEDWGPEA